MSEVTGRQKEYIADAPSDGGRHGKIYTSQAAYSYYERTGKRAKKYSPAHFKYAVRKESETYKIHHLDGIA